jgi:hypothetical protein
LTRVDLKEIIMIANLEALQANANKQAAVYGTEWSGVIYIGGKKRRAAKGSLS